MTRNPAAENAALRTRLRDTQARLNVLAAAVLADPHTAAGIARLLLTADSLGADGASQRPPSTIAGEPEARTLHKE